MHKLSSQNVDSYVDRLSRIAETAPPAFGSLTPDRMMAHLRRTFEISLGEYEMAMIPTPVPRAWLRWMVLSPMPWPKGRIKAPPGFTPDAEGLDAERQRLIETLRRFVSFAEGHPDERRNSPLAGPLTMTQWRRLHYRHLEHHLQQFRA